jgi:hypothetical protein
MLPSLAALKTAKLITQCLLSLFIIWSHISNAENNEVRNIGKCNPLSASVIAHEEITVTKKQAENKADTSNLFSSTAARSSNNPTVRVANVSQMIGGMSPPVIR